MEKINFQNNITKANAETMNTFQDNIEKAISNVQNNINQLEETINNYLPTTLFENESGLTGNITLSDSTANYNSIEIMYGADNYYFYTKIYNPNGKHFGLMTPYVSSANENQYLYTSSYLINGSQIQFEKASNTGINSSNSIFDFGTDSYIKIYKVLGYK